MHIALSKGSSRHIVLAITYLNTQHSAQISNICFAKLSVWHLMTEWVSSPSVFPFIVFSPLIGVRANTYGGVIRRAYAKFFRMTPRHRHRCLGAKPVACTYKRQSIYKPVNLHNVEEMRAVSSWRAGSCFQVRKAKRGPETDQRKEQFERNLGANINNLAADTVFLFIWV